MARDTALITGASTGIGATYADRLARRGYDLVLVARDARRMTTLAERLTAETGAQVDVLPADLGAAADLARVEQRLRDDAAISVLVNNAGMAGGGTVLHAEPDRMEAMIRLNVVAVTRLAVAIAPRLARQGCGTIINLSSVTAVMAPAIGPVYPGTKAFVLSFTEALAEELGPLGVRVQVVLPGATRTEIWERSGHDINAYPPEAIMEVGDMVDAALAGLDLGERVTIPSLPEMVEWQALIDARDHLRPNLSRSQPAGRYLKASAKAA
jgi:short-subunit dehydrogenase